MVSKGDRKERKFEFYALYNVNEGYLVDYIPGSEFQTYADASELGDGSGDAYDEVLISRFDESAQFETYEDAMRAMEDIVENNYDGYNTDIQLYIVHSYPNYDEYSTQPLRGADYGMSTHVKPRR
jgi:hypothetical protein